MTWLAAAVVLAFTVLATGAGLYWDDASSQVLAATVFATTLVAPRVARRVC